MQPKSRKIAPSEAEIRRWFLDMVREFERITGMSHSELGIKALNDSNFVFRLEDGKDFGTKNYRRLHAFMLRNWPRDTVPAKRNRAA